MAERLRETNAMLSQRAAKNVVKEIEENLTWGQRLADKVAELNGSWAFILFLVGLTLAWAAAEQVLAAALRRVPVSVFFNLLLAILVALQGPLIVMSQNRQTMKDRAQAETDFRVNLKNEVGIESAHRELAAFRAGSGKRLDVLERAPRADARAAAKCRRRRQAARSRTRRKSPRPPPATDIRFPAATSTLLRHTRLRRRASRFEAGAVPPL